jgi:type I restriction enzyme, S subunit
MGDPRYFGGAIPFVKISDVTASNGRVLNETSASVTIEGSKRSRLLPKGTLILSNSGTICVPVFLGVDACIHDGFVTFDDLPPDISGEFLFHFFNYVRPFLRYKHKQGVTQVNLNTGIVSEIPFPLPPLAEQRRIVAKIEELFSELDAGEDSLRRARRQLGVYRQSLLKQAFEGKLTEQWRKQNPHLLETPEQLLELCQEKRKASKDSETTSLNSRKQGAGVALDSQLVESLHQLPEFWRWTALGNLTELITKGSSPKWQGFDYTSDVSDVLFITSENVRSGFLDLTRPKYLGLGFNKVQAKSILRDGDVLLNIVGASIGRAAVFQGNAVANINQAVALIRLSALLNRVFLTHHLNSSRTYALITSKAVDVARANFSLADVNEIPIPLCSLPEQHEIVRLLDEQFTVIEQNEREIDAALKRSAALRQSILKKARRPARPPRPHRRTRRRPAGADPAGARNPLNAKENCQKVRKRSQVPKGLNFKNFTCR